MATVTRKLSKVETLRKKWDEEAARKKRPPLQPARETKTSSVRLAASRELIAGPLEWSSGTNLHSTSGTTLDNIIGPIPELVNEEPGWLAMYREAAARLPSLKEFLAQRSSDREEAALNADRVSSLASRLGKKSPYSQPPPRERRRRKKEGGNHHDDRGEDGDDDDKEPRIGFHAVYGIRHADGGRANEDDYAEAVKSLTSMGFRPGDHLYDPELLARSSSFSAPTPPAPAGVIAAEIKSKFPAVGDKKANKDKNDHDHDGDRNNGGDDGGGETPTGDKINGRSPYVCGGQGFLHKATSTSVLRALARQAFAREQARLRQLGLKTKAEEERERELRRQDARKRRKEQPATVRSSVQFDDGSKYRGDWSTRALGAHGHGTLYYRNGDRYVGHFKGHLFHGKGRYDYQNGDSYEGDWERGLKCGEGTFTRASDETRISGEWDKDMANGSCVCTYGNGAVYRGFYKDDMKEGFGKYVSATGDTYEGEFHADKIKGTGLFIDRKNSTSYHGQFHDSRRKATTDEHARFTLHHRLLGDFNKPGGVRYGGAGGKGGDGGGRGAGGGGESAKAALFGAPPTPRDVKMKQQQQQQQARKKKSLPLDMPAKRPPAAPLPLVATGCDESVAA